MKLDLQFPELARLIKEMGAQPSSWQVGSTNLDEIGGIEFQLEHGIEIPLEEVESAFGGLLTYKGEQVLLYIKDTHQSRSILLYSKEEARRFHVAECKTLEAMRRKRRFERYVVTTRKDGIFLVEATDPETDEVEELETELLVCKNCLNFLNYDLFAAAGVKTKDRIWKEFSLDEFFDAYITFFCSKPTYTDLTAPPGGYAPRWGKFSLQIRAERNWTCEKCGVKLEQHKSLLHAHHKNGVVSDNKHSNILVLCKECHSKEPDHGRIKLKLEETLLLQRLRLEQGLV